MDAGELDIKKFQTVLLALSKLRIIVCNDVFKTTLCDKSKKKLILLIRINQILKMRWKMLRKKYLILVSLLRLKTLRPSNKLLLR